MARERALNLQGRSIATLIIFLGLFLEAKLWFLAIKYEKQILILDCNTEPIANLAR